MSLYSETIETGSKKTWLAALEVICRNPFNGLPTVIMNEVRRTTFDDELIQEESTRQIRTTLSRPERLVPYIDINTFDQVLDTNNQPVSGMTFTAQQIYYALACLYIDCALQEDLKNLIEKLNLELADLQTIASLPGATQEQLDAVTTKTTELNNVQSELNLRLSW